MAASAIEGVLFDNDGTLVDTHDLIYASMRHATREVLGRELPYEVLMAKIGIPLATQMEDFTDDPEVQERLLVAYRAHNHDKHDEMIRAFDGGIECLAALQDAGLRLGVVTSKMHWLAWRGLEIVGMTPYLEVLIGADDCPVHKPEPDPVVAGCKALGLEPARCAYVGDSPFDIHAGNAAGCTTVAVTWGMARLDDLLAERPDHVCDTWEEVAAALL